MKAAQTLLAVAAGLAASGGIAIRASTERDVQPPMLMPGFAPRSRGKGGKHNAQRAGTRKVAWDKREAKKARNRRRK